MPLRHDIWNSFCHLFHAPTHRVSKNIGLLWLQKLLAGTQILPQIAVSAAARFQELLESLPLMYTAATNNGMWLFEQVTVLSQDGYVQVSLMLLQNSCHSSSNQPAWQFKHVTRKNITSSDLLPPEIDEHLVQMALKTFKLFVFLLQWMELKPMALSISAADPFICMCFVGCCFHEANRMESSPDFFLHTMTAEGVFSAPRAPKYSISDLQEWLSVAVGYAVCNAAVLEIAKITARVCEKIQNAVIVITWRHVGCKTTNQIMHKMDFNDHFWGVIDIARQGCSIPSQLSRWWDVLILYNFSSRSKCIKYFRWDFSEIKRSAYH